MTEEDMEAISKELDACEKKRLEASDNLFWRQMFYVVAGIAVMGVGLLLLERVYA